MKNQNSFTKRRRQQYVIPAYVLDEGKYKLISDFPDYEVFGDDLLGEVLNASKVTIYTWKTRKIIPYKKYNNGYAYHINDVISALKKAGYYQEPAEGSPTGPAQSQTE